MSTLIVRRSLAVIPFANGFTEAKRWIPSWQDRHSVIIRPLDLLFVGPPQIIYVGARRGVISVVPYGYTPVGQWVGVIPLSQIDMRELRGAGRKSVIEAFS